MPRCTCITTGFAHHRALELLGDNEDDDQHDDDEADDEDGLAATGSGGNILGRAAASFWGVVFGKAQERLVSFWYSHQTCAMRMMAVRLVAMASTIKAHIGRSMIRPRERTTTRSGRARMPTEAFQPAASARARA